MSEITKGGSSFIGYEYKEVPCTNENSSMYLDAYKSFGWVQDENNMAGKGVKQTLIKLKRDRKILNKTELTRLQQHFEACTDEIKALKKWVTSVAAMLSILTGLMGTAFMVLSTFAITNEPPHITACILFAIPGFLGWGLPYFIYKAIITRRGTAITPLIEKKYDEIYEICEKGSNLLSK